MREYINANTIANEIRMKRSWSDSKFLIVENDQEARAYKSFTDISAYCVVIAHTKDNITYVLNLLKKDNISNIFTTGNIDLAESDLDESTSEFWDYKQDPLWDIVGLGESNLSDLSLNHDFYLVEIGQEDKLRWPRKSL